MKIRRLLTAIAVSAIMTSPAAIAATSAELSFYHPLNAAAAPGGSAAESPSLYYHI